MLLRDTHGNGTINEVICALTACVGWGGRECLSFAVRSELLTEGFLETL